MFSTAPSAIEERIENLEPVLYGKTRNHIDGHVTYLSPYISRGVISTKYILERTLKRGFDPKKIEKFIQELAWRDYWQQIWRVKGELINRDLKASQPGVGNFAMPAAVWEAKTGIEAIDRAISKFYETGYLHNHVRMYIASICCNVGKSHWRIPAQWMYYFLLDGDWASNALSWQWIAGANSKKKYFANQDNINKFCHTDQKNTFLDVSYSQLEEMEIPDTLKDTIIPSLVTPLPEKNKVTLNSQLPTLIYNAYNLDPMWKADWKANRVLLLEPSKFKDYPVSQKTIDFVCSLANNIPGMQFFTGEFEDFINLNNMSIDNIYFKEHPLNHNYRGEQESREWMFDVEGYFSSFFKFWKNCKKKSILF